MSENIGGGWCILLQISLIHGDLLNPYNQREQWEVNLSSLAYCLVEHHACGDAHIERFDDARHGDTHLVGADM